MLKEGADGMLVCNPFVDVYVDVLCILSRPYVVKVSYNVCCCNDFRSIFLLKSKKHFLEASRNNVLKTLISPTAEGAWVDLRFLGGM